MAHNVFVYLTIFTTLFLQSCGSMEMSYTLAIPEEGFQVVQHMPKKAEGREQNTLYLSPRTIKEKEFNTPELNTYIDSLYAMMLLKDGVGIASNQIGKRLQIFIIEAENDNLRYNVLGSVPKQIFINPLITKTSQSRKNFWHGCLSAENQQRGNVATYEWIEYKCQNQMGKIQQGRLDGFAAVIFQHEFRHMLGGTYLDHANHLLPSEELSQKIGSRELPFFELASDTLPLLLEGYNIGESLDEHHAHEM